MELPLQALVQLTRHHRRPRLLCNVSQVRGFTPASETPALFPLLGRGRPHARAAARRPTPGTTLA